MRSGHDRPESAVTITGIRIRRIFPDFFKETNIHPTPFPSISYERKKGVVTASLTLYWQRLPDYKQGKREVTFTHQERRGEFGREYQWVCTAGMPD